MANTKNDEQKKQRVVKRGRRFSTKTLCGCRDGGVINCTRKYDVGSVKEIDKEDLQGLMRILSIRKGGGAAVDVDSEGNLVWRKQAAETSYGDGVGKIGRIDEDKPCCFSEVDVNKFRYFAIKSKRVNLAYI